MLTLLTATLLAAAPLQERVKDVNAYPQEASFNEVLATCTVEPPKELFEVLRVVDGDTLWIEREGKRVKLRLLSIDTEEKFMEGSNLSPSKPSTRYGDLVTGWTQGFFTPRSAGEGPVRVGLRFPGGEEAYDPYGRMLCHVVTESGVDFNLLMVRMGMSPYFNKYGSSRIDHERFASLQEAARKERRGIWNPETNRGGKRRDYRRLLPWWEARAEAVEAFRQMRKAYPGRWVAADDPDGLQAALGEKVTILGLVDRFFDEDDGSRTVLLRSGDKRRALRVRIEAADLEAMKGVDLEGSKEDFRQNYLLVTGRLEKGQRGFDLAGVKPADWRRAGPEPRG